MGAGHRVVEWFLEIYIVAFSMGEVGLVTSTVAGLAPPGRPTNIEKVEEDIELDENPESTSVREE